MDKTISVYWFVILGIVAVVIVLIVSSFYNAPYDVREVEARLLANKAADCISSQGTLSDLLFIDGTFNEEFRENFLEFCDIDFSVESDWQETQYYLKVDFFKVGDTSTPVFSIEKGNLNFISSCNVQAQKDYKKLAQCQEKRFYSVKNDQQFLIQIITAVAKSEKNVR